MSAGTAYSKRYGGGFADLPTQTTAIDQTFLNAVEAALLQLIGQAPTADGQVMQWDSANTRYGPALLLNKNIDAAAAISKSKLDFTGANGIVNADVAGAAAIARSKLDFGSGLVNADIATNAAIAGSKLNLIPATTLNASPTNGEVGILTDSTSAPTYAWAFVWNASASKWIFVGGSPLVGSTATASTTTSASYIAPTNNVTLTFPRAGDYIVRWSATLWVKTSNQTGWLAIKPTGVTITDTTDTLTQFSSAGQIQSTLANAKKVTGVAASDTVLFNFKVQGGATLQIDGPRLEIIPIAVT